MLQSIITLSLYNRKYLRKGVLGVTLLNIMWKAPNGFPQWVVLYYRTVWFHQTKTKNTHGLLILVASWGLIVTFSMKLKAKKKIILYCWSFQLLEKQLVCVLYLSSARPTCNILFLTTCYLTWRATFLCVESWNMDCINIFKGIKEQLDSEKRIRYCTCKWTRNLPARRPCTPELTFLCRKARTLLNAVSLKSFTLPNACSLLSVVFWIYQFCIFENQSFLLPT